MRCREGPPPLVGWGRAVAARGVRDYALRYFASDRPPPLPMRPDLTPLAFAIASRPGRFLFFDAFVRDQRLVLVSTYYPDVVFDFAQVEVRLDGQRLSHFEEIGANEYEPSRAIVYPLADPGRGPRLELQVSYQGQQLTASLAPDAGRPTREFAIATLFKDDFADIPTFYRYYKLQGVDRFYLYYNGDLSRVRRLLPDADDIVYGEWDFPYWLDPESEAFKSGLVDPQAARNKHHAQTAFLSMVRHRYLDDCSYLALIDLDEFLGIPGETVRDHVERANLPALTAPCHWAEVRSLSWLPGALWRKRGVRVMLAARARLWEAVRRRFASRAATPNLAFRELRHVWANARSEGGSRVKTVYRGDYPGLFGIHTPKPPTVVTTSDRMKLFHIVNTGHGRHTRIHGDAVPVPLIAQG